MLASDGSTATLAVGGDLGEKFEPDPAPQEKEDIPQILQTPYLPSKKEKPRAAARLPRSSHPMVGLWREQISLATHSSEFLRQAGFHVDIT